MRIFLIALLIILNSSALAESWSNPGENPFKGSKWHAVMSYEDVPLYVRIILGLRVQWDNPDFIAKIDKYKIVAENQVFTSDLIGMHFGKRKKFEKVDRSAWADTHFELSRMWCYEQWCIGSPYICNNIFLSTRRFDLYTPEITNKTEVVNKVGEPFWIFILVIVGCLYFSRKRL